jgi:hypothetical protein
MHSGKSRSETQKSKDARLNVAGGCEGPDWEGTANGAGSFAARTKEEFGNLFLPELFGG